MDQKPIPECRQRRVENRATRAAVAAILVAAALTIPVQASHAGGVNLSIPPNAPSLQSFQAASAGTNNESIATNFGLVPLTDAAGKEVTVSTANGVAGIVYLDPVGNVIVAYSWDATPVEGTLTNAIISGYGPSMVPGYADAVTFLQTAEAAAASHGIPISKVYITGFSLGAMLASYVGSQTGLPGVAFASCGIPDYKAPASPAGNFISFVEANDPVAQYATDSLERASAGAANPRMDHYGTVIPLGTLGAEETQFNSNIGDFTLPEFAAGTLPITASQTLTVEIEYNDLLGAAHNLNTYDPDAYALARSYGIDPTQP